MSLQRQVCLTIQMLESLGWIINYEKSVLVPSKTITYLGIQWNPWSNLKHLPEEKIPPLKSKLTAMVERKNKSRGFAKFGRSSQFCQFHCATRPAPHCSIVKSTQHNVERVPQAVTLHSTGCQTEPKVVARELQTSISNSHSTTLTLPDHRRVGSSMGGSFGQLFTNRVLDGLRARSSLQSERNVSNFKSFKRSLSVPESQHLIDTVRQQNRDCISPTRGRYQINPPVKSDTSNLPNSRRISHSCEN